MSLSLNLLVLRSKNPEKLASFYENFGLNFTTESHGHGPRHKVTSLGGAIFEIYPLQAGQPTTLGTRIGFSVASIDNILSKLGDDAQLIAKRSNTCFGSRAVLQDPEGHKVELFEAKG